MQIDHAIDAFVLRLEFDESLDRAEVIPEVKVSGGLNAGEYPLVEGGHLSDPFEYRGASCHGGARTSKAREESR